MKLTLYLPALLIVMLAMTPWRELSASTPPLTVDTSWGSGKTTTASAPEALAEKRESVIPPAPPPLPRTRGTWAGSSAHIKTVRSPVASRRSMIPKHILNALVSFERNDWNRAISWGVERAITAGEPVICPAVLFAQLLNKLGGKRTGAKIGIEKIHAELDAADLRLICSPAVRVYNQQPGNFVVVIPRNGPSIDYYGFNVADLRHVKPNKVVGFFAGGAAPTVQVSDDELIASFVRLFRKSSGEGREVHSRRFVIVGHGNAGSDVNMTDGFVAGLKLTAFVNLLKALNELCVEFVYTDSCFLGGRNTIAIQAQLEAWLTERREQNIAHAWNHERKERLARQRTKISQQSEHETELTRQRQTALKIARADTSSPPYFKLNYPLAIRATTDVSTIGAPGLQRFFRTLDVFLGKENPPWYSGEELSNLFETLEGNSKLLGTLPSVLLPGSNTFFTTPQLRNMAVVTWQSVQRERLVRALTKESAGRVWKLNLKSLAPRNLKFVLMYPCDMSDMAIDLSGCDKDIGIVSKIPSKAQHYLGRLTLDQDPTRVLAHSLSVKLDPSGKECDVYGVSPKAWFLTNLRAPGTSGVHETFRNFVAYVGPTIESETFPLVLSMSRKIGSMSYELRVGVSPRTVTKVMDISDEIYYWLANAVFCATRADERALREATGGNENSQTEEAAFDKFLANAGVREPSNELSFKIAIKILEKYMLFELATTLTNYGLRSANVAIAHTVALRISQEPQYELAMQAEVLRDIIATVAPSKLDYANLLRNFTAYARTLLDANIVALPDYLQHDFIDVMSTLVKGELKKRRSGKSRKGAQARTPMQELGLSDVLKDLAGKEYYKDLRYGLQSALEGLEREFGTAIIK